MLPETNGKGLVFVLVGPSGVGKNTLMSAALGRFEDTLRQLPTATTRDIRDNEKEGREHFFHTEESFDRLIEENALLEWQWVHGKRYGIIRSTIEAAISHQNDLIADIEVLGASIVRDEFPENAVLIFVSPPDREVLEERIRARGADDEETIAIRLQRVPFEMKFAAICHYIIVNDELDRANEALINIIAAECSRRNLRSLAVSAMFHINNEILVRTGTDETFPSTSLLPGEVPEVAVTRLAAAYGLTGVNIRPQPGTPDDAPAPAHFTMNKRGNRGSLTLVYACDVERQTCRIEGWEWKPVEVIPMAAAYL
jgi:guanylate kinase